MAKVKLKKIISQQKFLDSLIANFIELQKAPITVYDLDGNLIAELNESGLDSPLYSHPIVSGDEKIGVVKGTKSAAIIAEILSAISVLEVEKKALGSEVLDLYRELNLLYNLSKKLTASLDLKVVAKMTLDESSRLIKATVGSVYLYDEVESTYNSIASFGNDIALNCCLSPDTSIVDSVIASGDAKIINDVRSYAYYAACNDKIHSLICVPLKPKIQTIGVILLASETSDVYTAADLNLLNTVAAQAAPIIENTLLHEKALQEAKTRERLLRIQIQELRIELDKTKQKQKVTEITESDYFQRLRDQAGNLRNIIDREY